MDDESAIYGLKHTARCIASQANKGAAFDDAPSASDDSADAGAAGGSVWDASHFFVATATLRTENEIHLVAYDEENNDVGRLARFVHPPEVTALAPCPEDVRPFFFFFFFFVDVVVVVVCCCCC